MATLIGAILTDTFPTPQGDGLLHKRIYPGASLVPAGGVKYYKMRARDSVCVSQPSYVTWVVTGSPDPTAAQFDVGNLPCGSDISDLVDIQVEAHWVDIV